MHKPIISISLSPVSKHVNVYDICGMQAVQALQVLAAECAVACHSLDTAQEYAAALTGTHL